MNRLYIWGAGKFGEYLKKKIDNYYTETVEVLGFIDSVKQGSYLDVPIVELKEIECAANIVIAIGNLNDVSDIYLRLKREGRKNVYWYSMHEVNGIKCDNFLKNECIFMESLGEDILPHLEFHISDKCNLNCKGCTHFSPLFHEIGDSYKIRMGELKKLLSKISNIMKLDILGGEPLLNPELGKYIKGIRTLLPDTCVDVFTNGLLVPQMKPELLQCIKENNVFMSISEYKPTHDMREQIITKLEEYQIPYYISQYDRKQVFNRPISLSEHSKYPQCCISNGCVTIGNGSIARCPTLMYITKFNEVFHTQLPAEGIISLEDPIQGRELLDMLRKEVPLCRHCIKCDMKWDVCRGKECLEDFAVFD